MASIESSHLLVVDDDKRIRELLGKYLVDQGFFVTTAEDARAARVRLKEYVFDLLIVDAMMPGESGYELTRAVRESLSVPVMMLTARSEVESRISGLEAGADDYLGKPFDPRELLLRIESILRRTRPEDKEGIKLGMLMFFPAGSRLMRGSEIIPLSTAEANLLALLVRYKNTAISRSQLAEESGGVNERSIDVQINRLRLKIEADPKKPCYLQTVRGEGYGLFVG